MTKILGYISKGKSDGARLLTGGKRVGSKGFFIEPTVFADVKVRIFFFVSFFFFVTICSR